MGRNIIGSEDPNSENENITPQGQISPVCPTIHCMHYCFTKPPTRSSHLNKEKEDTLMVIIRTGGQKLDHRVTWRGVVEVLDVQ